MHYLAIGIRKIIAGLDYKAYIEIGFTLVASRLFVAVINETSFFHACELVLRSDIDAREGRNFNVCI